MRFKLVHDDDADPAPNVRDLPIPAERLNKAFSDRFPDGLTPDQVLGVILDNALRDAGQFVIGVERAAKTAEAEADLGDLTPVDPSAPVEAQAES